MLVPLHRERGRSAVTVAGGVPGLERFSVEDVYVHPALFGTSPYAPLVEEKLAEYRALVATPAAQREGPQSERLRALARELRALQLDGDLP